MSRKYDMHVPVEMYGYIGCEVEGEAKDAVEAYQTIAQAIKFGGGLAEDEFRKLYDGVAAGLATNGDPGILDQCNGFQRFAINEAKKFLKRKAGIKNTMSNYTKT